MFHDPPPPFQIERGPLSHPPDYVPFRGTAFEKKIPGTWKDFQPGTLGGSSGFCEAPPDDVTIRNYEEIYGKHEEICEKYEKIFTQCFVRGESSYVPLSLYKGPGTWNNSELSPCKLWDLKKLRVSLPV